jgi:hypothetical protein
MCTHELIVWIVCGILGVILLITAGTQLDYINIDRQEMKLTSNRPLENAPPSLALATVAMGSFRGLIVDVLWMRADKLKEKGQFFDARQLAEWITILQPRFAAVWEFQAWNMAYNISVAIPATQTEERWMWVKNGFELLRDQAIPLNPKSIRLYHQLAWIFQHKIGGISDDAHKYYKLQLAAAMEPLLRSEDSQLNSEDECYFEALTNAPQEWRQIKNAVLSFYMAGHKSQAMKIYHQIKELYPLAEFMTSLEVYVRKRFREELESLGIHDAKEQITMLLRESYYLYGIGSDNEAAGRENLAKEIRQHYATIYSDKNRIDLPTMKLLRYVALIDFLNDRRYPLYLRATLLQRMKIEKPDVYGQIQEQLKQQAEEATQQIK